MGTDKKGTDGRRYVCVSLCNMKSALICVRGMTLIEVLFVILVVAILMFPLANQFRHVRVAWDTGDKRSDLFQNTRIGFDKMIRELKAAKRIISVTAAGNSTGKIVFTDKNDNTAIFERFLNGGKYWLGYTTSGSSPSAPGDILAGPINSLKFTCYKGDGITETTKPRAIKSIKIEMETASEEGGINPETFVGQIIIEKDMVTLAINEIFYNPPAGYNDDFYEYIELYNSGGADIDVGGWLLSDNQATDTITGDDVRGNGSTVIPAGGYAIITDRDTRIYTEIVSNGGFESADLSMWQRSGGWQRLAGGHSGSWRIQRNNAGWIYQTVNIPSTARSAFFSCWESGTGTRLVITVRNTFGVVLATLYDGPISPGWTQHTADLSAYIGTTIRIYFETFVGGQYRLDDISINYSLIDRNAVRLRVDDTAIGGGLSNAGETLTLQIPGANGQVVDSVTYSDSWGGDGNGFSLERIDAEDESDSAGNWSESIRAGGTPGFKNDATP